MMTLFLTEQDVSSLLTIEDTLDAVETVFRLQATGDATNEPRRRSRAAGAVIHVMSGAISGFGEHQGLLGVKTYTVTGRGVRFYVNLFDASTGRLLAFIEADKLGQMRTGAASGVATKYMAREKARTVGIYGTGWQARTQLAAVCAVRPIDSVKVFSRSAEKRETFCSAMQEELKIASIVPVDSPEAAADAEILITITSSRDPVLLGQWIRPGTHINAAGSNSILRQELDDAVIKQATLITVDSLEQARIEAGELVNAVEKGILTWERVRELRYVVNGELPGRNGDDQITLFKSLGIAIEDIVTAAIVYEKAKEQRAGREL